MLLYFGCIGVAKREINSCGEKGVVSPKGGGGMIRGGGRNESQSFSSRSEQFGCGRLGKEVERSKKKKRRR